MLTIINNLHLCKFSWFLVFEGRELNKLAVKRNPKGSVLKGEKVEIAPRGNITYRMQRQIASLLFYVKESYTGKQAKPN
jgi:hypothetical protein